jgi:hypothetical protein
VNVFFGSEVLGLVFSSNLSMGEFCPLPAESGISPIDKLLKDSALPPVTSEKLTLFLS